MQIANRLGAHDAFANNIPPQISERLQPVTPIVETRDERRAWGAFDLAREVEEGSSATNGRKRKTRSVTASPAEPLPEPERKLKRPRTRRLPTQNEASTSASSPMATGPSTVVRQLNGAGTVRNGASSTPSVLVPTTAPTTAPVAAPSAPSSNAAENETPLVSSLLKELEPNAPSEDEGLPSNSGWRMPPEASSPAMSRSPSAYSSPRALSLTPPPLPSVNGRPSSPTLSLSTHIQPRYLPANYSPTRNGGDQSDSESRPSRAETRSVELRQPRPRRAHPIATRVTETSPTRAVLSQEEKKNINDIVKGALRPHWRAQKLTTEQYATINRDISRKLYDEVGEAASLDEESRGSWEKKATKEVAQALAALQA
jgi:hypothetical protein